jgi:hypothetical protein
LSGRPELHGLIPLVFPNGVSSVSHSDSFFLPIGRELAPPRPEAEERRRPKDPEARERMTLDPVACRVPPVERPPPARPESPLLGAIARPARASSPTPPQRTRVPAGALPRATTPTEF